MSPSFFRPYSEAEYRKRELLCSILMLPGLVWLVVLGTTGWGVGVISAMAAVYAGAVFGCYRTRKSEQGVWMIALLCGVCAATFYLFTIAMEIRDAVQQRTPPPWWLLVDVGAAGWIQTVVVRASWMVIVQNRRLRGRAAEGADS